MIFVYSILIFLAVVILLLIVLSLFLNIKVLINTIYTDNDRIISVKIALINDLVKFKFMIPLKPNRVKEEIEDLERKRDISILQQVDFFINLYSNAHTTIIRFLQSVQIYNMNYHIHFGTGNSALTGVSIGAAYSLIGIIENILKEFTILHKPPNIDITPNYYASILEATGKIRFSFSIRKAIYTAFLLFRVYRRTQKEFKETHPFETL